LKSIKNQVELEGARACHIRDGAAVAECLSFLEEKVSLKNEEISEVEIDLLVTECRKNCGLYIENSFDTIAGVNENAAIIHYRFFCFLLFNIYIF
jgi:Xaa-Pro aminopeptidase